MVKRILKIAALLFIGATCFVFVRFLLGSSRLCGDQGRPNFVIIFADDLGYNDIGCFGAKKIETAHLDRMAREGMKLTSFYSQPVCGPARATLLTGCYPNRVNRGGWNVMPEEITIAEILRDAGYQTGCIVKCDISGRRFREGMVPNDQGFSYYFGTLGANDKGEVTLYRNKEVLGETSDMGSLTRLYTEEAIDFINENKSGPFFLYLAHTMPHVELGVSVKFAGNSERGLYGDVIEEMDWNVGRIMATLKKLRLHKNTIVLFTSDNGPWLSKGEFGGSALPLRGGKGSAWEGGFRVPCIFWGPGKVPAGVESDQLMATLDILPTFAALAGGEVPADRIIDGRDQSGFLTGASNYSGRDEFFYYVRGNLHAVRKGKWKLALPGRKKFHGYATDDPPVLSPELYDLEWDISEKQDVADENPEVVRQLTILSEQARLDIGDVDIKGNHSRRSPE